MKLFLATPISSLPDPEAFAAYRESVARLAAALQKEHTVFCELAGLEALGQYVSPRHSFQRDISALDACDALILHYPAPTPTSALIELGYAVAANKAVLLLTPDRSRLPYLVQELDEARERCRIIESADLGAETGQRILEFLRE